jgi:alpha-mannosidase
MHRTRICRGLGLALLVLAPAGASAQAPERHYIANDDHTDYFWSGDDAEYRRAFLGTLDYYMDQIEETADRPPDGRSRYNVDGSFWLYEYETNRPRADFERLVEHVRAGSISVPFQSLVLLPGAMPTEAVLRDMYYAGSLERRFGLDLDLVVNMENQTLPLGLASLWAGAGARYSWRGVCACATNVSLDALIDRPREIYHYTGLDGASVLLKWQSMVGNNQGLGGYAEARDPAGIVQYMSEDALFRQRWPYRVFGAFGYGWDDLETRTTAFIDAAAALGRPNRRVIVSNEVDFFRDFEATHGANLPRYTAAFGNEWDLYVASMASVSGPFRRAVAELRTAEAAAAMVTLAAPGVLPDRTAERTRAFLDMGLFYEHDWVANGSVPQARRIQFQRDTLARVQRYVAGLRADAFAALGDRIPGPANGASRYAVYNALGAPRTGPVDLPHPGAGPFTVVDVETGAEVPNQTVSEGLRILAEAVPAVGYRTYDVRAGAGRDFGAAAEVRGATLDNGRLTLRLRGDGALDSVVHVGSGRELVGAGGTWNLQSAAPGAAVRAVEVGPVSASLEVDVATNPRHRTRVTLHRGLDHVEIRNDVTQGFSETVGYGFDLGLRGQTLHHEEVGAVLRVGRLRDGGHYADEGARVDFLTLNHFVDASEPGFGITLAARDSQFFRAGQSDVDTLDTATPRLFAVLGMQVDGRHLGIVDQGYDERFEADFALRAHDGYDAASAMRFGLETQTPLAAFAVDGPAGAPLPAGAYGVLVTDTPEAVLFAFKPAEAGDDAGVVMRWWHLGDGEGALSVRPTARPFASARAVSHVEIDGPAVPLVAGALEDRLPHQALRSYRVTFGPGDPPPPPVDAGLPPPPVDAGGPPPPLGDARPPASDAALENPFDAGPTAADLAGDARTDPPTDGGAPPTDRGPDTRAPVPDDAALAAGDGAPGAGGRDAVPTDAVGAGGTGGSGAVGPEVGPPGAEPASGENSGGAGCACRVPASGSVGGGVWAAGACLFLRRRRRR